MSDCKTITLSITDEEWTILNSEAHFNQLTIEHYVKQLISLYAIQPILEAQTIFSNPNTSEAYRSFIENLQYYLSETIKIAEGYEDSRMVDILKRLRDEKLNHHALAQALFIQSDYSKE